MEFLRGIEQSGYPDRRVDPEPGQFRARAFDLPLQEGVHGPDGCAQVEEKIPHADPHAFRHDILDMGFPRLHNLRDTLRFRGTITRRASPVSAR